jgi:hypothetical protein
MKYLIQPIVLNLLTGATATKMGLQANEEVGSNYTATVILFTSENKAIDNSISVEIKGQEYKDWTGDNQTILDKIEAERPIIVLTGDVEENITNQTPTI